ncbi:MAG TPA: DUF1801 domain-containing protein [Chitinophagaceae bacterium]|nr:DUF1801 domain-containing protein [Chitinophagaceae bacterium]
MAKTSTSKKLAVLKTKENDASVEGFLQAVADEGRRKDAAEILSMMKKITREKPKMWGASIIGFGNYIYESPKTGRSGEWFLTGFSPRKQNITIYFITGFAAYNDLMKKLGKYKISGGSCLYINRLADVDSKILKELIERSYKNMKEKHAKK